MGSTSGHPSARSSLARRLMMVPGVVFLMLQGCASPFPPSGANGPEASIPTASPPTLGPVAPALPTPTSPLPPVDTAIPAECKLLNVSTAEVSGYAIDRKRASETLKVTLFRVSAQTASGGQRACNAAGCHSSVPSGSAPSSHNDGRLDAPITTTSPTTVTVATMDANLEGSTIESYPSGIPGHGYRFTLQSVDSAQRPVAGDRVFVAAQGTGGRVSSETKVIPSASTGESKCIECHGMVLRGRMPPKHPSYGNLDSATEAEVSEEI